MVIRNGQVRRTREVRDEDDDLWQIVKYNRKYYIIKNQNGRRIVGSYNSYIINLVSDVEPILKNHLFQLGNLGNCRFIVRHANTGKALTLLTRGGWRLGYWLN